MPGLSYEVESYADKGMRGLDSVSATTSALTKKVDTEYSKPDKTAGGAAGSAATMGLAGFEIGGPWGGAIGGAVGAAAYLFS